MTGSFLGLALATGLLVPLLTGLATKSTAAQGVKAVTTLVLSAIAGIVQILITTSNGVISQTTVKAAVATWFTAIISHYGLWKPTTVSSAVQSLLPNVGIGAGPPAAVTAPVEPVAGAIPQDVLTELGTRLGFTPPGPQTPPPIESPSASGSIS